VDEVVYTSIHISTGVINLKIKPISTVEREVGRMVMAINRKCYMALHRLSGKFLYLVLNLRLRVVFQGIG
jgi:hypothetical protein